MIIGHETLAHYISRQINRPTIIKIHRDLLFDPKNTVEEVEVLHDNWKKALDNVFSDYHPIFIGYAGNDNSLMDFLIENSEKFLKDEWSFPYWLMYKTDKIEGKVLEFLEQTNGYLIRHNGFDEVLYMLGAAFDYKLPSKETFLSDAEKRFQMLSSSIDEFTEKSAAGKDSESDERNDEDDSVEIDQAVYQITNQAELQRMYREAVMLNNTGKYEEALKEIEKAIELEPDNVEYHDSYEMLKSKLNS
ncbi:MAG: hypothetical protein IJO85_09825 [Lachnospiraceae bacterium]|nr:hypothetical protein [Lachnospiraceae bacterium]